jgi:hypothetical protein
MVTIYAGPKKTKFVAHKERLCERSPYFAQMFGKGSKEAITETAELPEIDDNYFDFILSWIYYQALPPYEEPLSREAAATVNWELEGFYALAHMFQIPRLMDHIMAIYLEEMSRRRKIPTLLHISSCYENNAPQAVRKLMSFFTAYIISKKVPYILEERISERLAKYSELLAKHPDLNRDVIKLLWKYKGKVPDPRKQSLCLYHEHEAEEPCTHFG